MKMCTDIFLPCCQFWDASFKEYSVKGQIYKDISVPSKGYCVYYPSNIL